MTFPNQFYNNICWLILSHRSTGLTLCKFLVDMSITFEMIVLSDKLVTAAFLRVNTSKQLCSAIWAPGLCYSLVSGVIVSLIWHKALYHRYLPNEKRISTFPVKIFRLQYEKVLQYFAVIAYLNSVLHQFQLEHVIDHPEAPKA